MFDRRVLLACFAVGCLQTSEAPVTPTPGTEPSCTVRDIVRCGDVITGTTEGASANIDSWSCVSFDDPGPEVIYRFLPNVDGTAIVTLTDLEQDLDLFVTGPECTDGTCTSSASGGTTDEQVAGPIIDRESYHITVDSFGMEPSGFTLSVSCE